MHHTAGTCLKQPRATHDIQCYRCSSTCLKYARLPSAFEQAICLRIVFFVMLLYILFPKPLQNYLPVRNRFKYACRGFI